MGALKYQVPSSYKLSGHEQSLCKFAGLRIQDSKNGKTCIKPIIGRLI